MNTYQFKLLVQTASAMFGLVLMTSIAHADPRDSIVYDSISGNYTIIYANPGNTTVYRMLFIPATKIDPSVRSSFRREDNMSIVYRYQVKSGKASKQYLEGIYIDPASNIVADRPLPLSLSEDINKSDAEMQADIDAGQKAVAHPSGWDGIALPSQGYGLRISWNTINSNISSGLPPGGSLNGLGFTSLDLPGIGDMQFRGEVHYTEFLGYDDDEMLEPTSEVAQELTKLENHDFVLRPAAIPNIAVPVPFDAAVLLDRIQTQMHTWIGMQLLDATFSSQLDRYLVAAADAYRHNQPKAGKDHIEILRKMLKKEHEDLGRDEEHESEKSQEKNDDKKSVMIAHLAARVLDFDLKYVIKRMGGDRDD
jgi:hypothetical protein